MFFTKYFFPLTAFFLVFFYFLTRLTNILSLPIFTDEAIYVRWAQIALNDASWRFISLTDGKQPMLIWLAMGFLKFIQEPLLAVRLVSVFSGLASMIGIFFLTKELFKNSKIGLLASFLYLIFPFALVYDRLALYDSLVASFMIWSLYLEILLVRNLRLDLALLLGAVVGGGMLTKSSADFALILIPFSLLLFNFKSQGLKKRLLRFAMYGLLAVIVANLFYSILRLSPFFYIIEQKNYLFIYSPGEWLSHPFAFFLGNLKTFLGWLIGYSSAPFILLIILAFLISNKLTREKLLLLSWFLAPLIATSLFGRLLYPRFLLFMTMFLIPLAALSLSYLLQKSSKFYLRSLILLAFVFSFIFKDFFIVHNFQIAPIPQSDKGQFITGWPSGVGVKESIKFFEKEAKNKKIFIATQGTFGLMPYALEIYLHKNPNIEIKGYWPLGNIPPEEVMQKAKSTPTYFIFYQLCDYCPSYGLAPEGWPVTKIMQFEKIEKGQYYTLYKIKQK